MPIHPRNLGGDPGAGGEAGGMTQGRPASSVTRPLYTAEQRRRRDQSPWTLVQGVLAPVQFLVFLVSLGLVLRALYSGEGQGVAIASVVVKTLTLYAIMITGAIWEKVVFDRYLLALHTAYLAALALGWLDARGLMWLALAAYATYVINAAQFVLKLRAARLQSSSRDMPRASAGLEVAP